jgi:hypothetical protein
MPGRAVLKEKKKAGGNSAGLTISTQSRLPSYPKYTAKPRHATHPAPIPYFCTTAPAGRLFRSKIPTVS